MGIGEMACIQTITYCSDGSQSGQYNPTDCHDFNKYLISTINNNIWKRLGIENYTQDISLKSSQKLDLLLYFQESSILLGNIVNRSKCGIWESVSQFC